MGFVRRNKSYDFGRQNEFNEMLLENAEPGGKRGRIKFHGKPLSRKKNAVPRYYRDDKSCIISKFQA